MTKILQCPECGAPTQPCTHLDMSPGYKYVASSAEREREAASKAWDEAVAWVGRMPASEYNAARDRYLQREYPPPAPASVTLSDGSVVRRRYQDNDESAILERGQSLAIPSRWFALVKPTDTGADFDSLKSFAAGVGR